MLYIILNYFRDLQRPHRDLLLENLALRQQILALERQVKRPRFKDRDRAFWVLLSRYWPGWRNPLWGAPRIHGELIMLGIYVCESTVAIDFLTVPTVTFKNLYVFLVLSLDRRRVIHFNVTTHPTADWTAIQLIQAFPFETAEGPELGPVMRRPAVNGLHSGYYRQAA